jgi:hypothetical protein
MDPLPRDDGRVVLSKSNPPPEPGHADTLKPSQERVDADDENDKDIAPNGKEVKTQAEMPSSSSADAQAGTKYQNNGNGKKRQDQHSRHPSSKTSVKEDAEDYDVDFWEPRPPKVLMEDPNAVPLELRAQIQLYAMTE